ncbi:MAG: hypothetical protein WAV89_15130, partial [Ignavibacteriaceae bacterium]
VSLKRSSFQGNAFTWKNIYTAYNNFYLSLDESQSGAIYLADGKRIYYSSDYGATFTLFKELEKKLSVYIKNQTQINFMQQQIIKSMKLPTLR